MRLELLTCSLKLSHEIDKQKQTYFDQIAILDKQKRNRCVATYVVVMDHVIDVATFNVTTLTLSHILAINVFIIILFIPI